MKFQYSDTAGIGFQRLCLVKIKKFRTKPKTSIGVCLARSATSFTLPLFGSTLQPLFNQFRKLYFLLRSYLSRSILYRNELYTSLYFIQFLRHLILCFLLALNIDLSLANGKITKNFKCIAMAQVRNLG